MLIVDAHLDLAYNANNGRDVLRSALEQTPDKDGIPTVGLPDLNAGRVGLICGTIFVAPGSYEAGGYQSASEAHQQAQAQMVWYQQQESAGRMAIVRKAADLPADQDPGDALRNLVLMEGADPIESPDDAAWWFDQGVRIVGLAWKQTRYAGGTGAPGGLSLAGVEMVKKLDDLGIIHDASHLAEQAFWQLLEHTDRAVMASHSNCRSIVPSDRQLSDDMIRAIAQRGGVIGINFYDRFLLPADWRDVRRATLQDVLDHVKHICDLTGSADNVGIGTDFDGGLGREQIPQEITTAADLHLLADAASRAGFSAADTQKLMSANWLAFFRKSLPAART